MNDSLTDSVETKPKLVPELRFPEFENDGEWDLKLFSKFIKLDRGSSPRPIQEYLTQDESGVNWIKIGDTKNAVNSIINQVEEKITSIGAQKSRRVEKGELILANSMSFGKTYELAIEGCIYDGWFVLRKYEKHFIKQFLLQMLNSDYMQNQYKRLSAGGIVQNISSDIVYNSQLFHTSISEQQKIASCLSSLDELITANREKLEALQAHKKGLIQNLFPQEGQTVPNFRFPEFEDDGDWEMKSIEKYIDLNSGIALKSEEISSDKSGTPILRGINITEGQIRHSEEIDKFYLGDISEIERYLIEENDIVIGMDGSKVGKNVALITKKDAGSILIQRVARIRPVNSNVYFLYQHFVSDRFRRYVDTVNTSSGIPHISSKQIRDFEIAFPPKIKEQQKIAACLTEVDKLITAQTEKIDRLLHHKKGLMQGLFPKNLD